MSDGGVGAAGRRLAAAGLLGAEGPTEPCSAGQRLGGARGPPLRAGAGGALPRAGASSDRTPGPGRRRGLARPGRRASTVGPCCVGLNLKLCLLKTTKTQSCGEASEAVAAG